MARCNSDWGWKGVVPQVGGVGGGLVGCRNINECWLNDCTVVYWLVIGCLLRSVGQDSAFGRGDILVSICHHPAANRLTVVILKARNLPKMDITGLAGKSIAATNNY